MLKKKEREKREKDRLISKLGNVKNTEREREGKTK